MREVSLSSFEAFKDTRANATANALEFEIASKQWDYGLALPLSGFWQKLPKVIEVDVEIKSGIVRIECLDLKSHGECGGKVTIAAPFRGKVRVLLEKSAGRPVMMMRNAAADGSRALGSLHAVVRLDNVDAAEFRRLKAKTWDYWHYSYELGEGARVEATIDGIMPMHRLNQKIMFHLLKTGFGDISGKRIVDVACASGFHTMEMARQGARMVGVDIDAPSIEQARFLQQCSDVKAVRDIRFELSGLHGFKPPEPFDIGFCSGLFYHLLDPVGGAQALYNLVKEGAVVHSHIVDSAEAIMALADSSKYKCCFDGEFALMPSRSMLERIFAHVGFKVKSFSPRDVVSDAEIDSLAPEFSTLFASGNTAYYLLTK